MALETEKIVREETAGSSYKPKNALGERLVAIRAKIVASGIPLLDPGEVEEEVAARRGGYQGDSR